MSESTEKGLDVLVSKKALRIVPLKALKVDPSYQRGLVPKHKKIVSDFDPDALGIPLVAQREDGSLWVVDGQQRCKALELLGKKEVRAEVFVSDGPEHEARVFKAVNKNRTGLHACELFHALVTSGDEECWAVKKLAEKHGLTIPRKRTHGQRDSDEFRSKQLQCINTIVRAYHTHGSDCVEFIFRVIKEAWPDDVMRFKTEIVEGMMMFWGNMKGEVDESRFVHNLKSVTPAKVIYSAGLGIGSRAANVSEQLMKVYRKRLKKA